MEKRENPPRLTVDEQFDLLALIFSCRGTCDRLRHGTVIRNKEKKIVTGGYNGSLPGQPHCDDVGHELVEGHCERTFHGEENAIYNCLDHSQLRDSIATVTGTPCHRCAKMLIKFGVKKIRCLGQYSNARGFKRVNALLEENNVKIEYVDPIDVLFTLQKAIDFLQGPGGFFKNLSQVTIRKDPEK